MSEIRRQRLRKRVKRVIGCKLVQHIYIDCMGESMVQIEASKWKVSCENIRNLLTLLVDGLYVKL
jgi:hypothetical protein